jgi:hypothetical protein
MSGDRGGHKPLLMNAFKVCMEREAYLQYPAGNVNKKFHHLSISSKRLQ